MGEAAPRRHEQIPITRGEQMSFQQLCWAATIIRGERDPLHLVHEWSSKREALYVQLCDFPQLVEDFKRHGPVKDPTNPHRYYIDKIPMIRLANACESTCHALYATAEVAASFANKMSNGVLSSSFNAIRKKVRDGQVDSDLATTLADLQWYEKVREVRTEWTHHSSIFIANGDNGPIFVLRSYRRASDKDHFKTESRYPVSEIIHWAKNAIALLDSFGAYLLKKYVIPSFDLDAKFVAAKREPDGFPVILPNGCFEVETITVREYLIQYGVELLAKPPTCAQPVAMSPDTVPPSSEGRSEQVAGDEVG
jgi:hypothetical protein